MKTSVIEVPDMLSVLTVDEVEKRIGEVPGVESATVNYAAGNATVRYDESLLDVADIKVLVHQRGQQPESDSQAKHPGEHKPPHKHPEAPTPDAAPASAAPPEPAVQKAAPVAPAAMTDPGAPVVKDEAGKAAPVAAHAPAAAAPNA